MIHKNNLKLHIKKKQQLYTAHGNKNKMQNGKTNNTKISNCEAGEH